MNRQPRVPPAARHGGRTNRRPLGHAPGPRPTGIRPAQQQLVVEHLSLADSVAWRYRGSGRDWADLRQVARLGLVKAVSGFDAAKGDSFAAYALPTVSGEVKRYLRDHGWMIRPPRPLQELRARVNVAKAELAHTMGREPSVAQLADELEVDRKDVEEALQCEGALRPSSFEARTSESDLRSLSDTLGAHDPNLDRAEQRASLASALRELTAWERRLLFLRYFEERKQQDIADELDISQMQVSRVLAKLLQRLRAQLEEPAG
ncbi:sigma-70 family RNA polymerase sigma factor [Paenarthrobacter sp. DKR-5]|uniref:sigma-70 family RNA polymerase sigma factor n=1 Tax=Paenarthrobacter sp. DKR-5 TaxID=2835535 RepID=UPI001BDC7E4E|nr:sigma-70 family RNA polymerase sigma factor [Paenarthrobacter sp. DKR-5]MBT1001506.1 sigma-70 family RNA polymerase sigma factor [Paenarthrobacter sp. DKR-5]